MTTWYGWLALTVALSCAAHDGYALVINAWRGHSYAAAKAICWFTVWTSLAVALVLA